MGLTHGVLGIDGGVTPKEKLIACGGRPVSAFQAGGGRCAGDGGSGGWVADVADREGMAGGGVSALSRSRPPLAVWCGRLSGVIFAALEFTALCRPDRAELEAAVEAVDRLALRRSSSTSLIPRLLSVKRPSEERGVVG